MGLTSVISVVKISCMKWKSHWFARQVLVDGTSFMNRHLLLAGACLLTAGCARPWDPEPRVFRLGQYIAVDPIKSSASHRRFYYAYSFYDADRAYITIVDDTGAEVARADLVGYKQEGRKITFPPLSESDAGGISEPPEVFILTETTLRQGRTGDKLRSSGPAKAPADGK